MSLRCCALTEGETNKVIARALAISKNTVEFHIKNLYRKLKVKTRTQAATKAIREGWR